MLSNIEIVDSLSDKEYEELYNTKSNIVIISRLRQLNTKKAKALLKKEIKAEIFLNRVQ